MTAFASLRSVALLAALLMATAATASPLPGGFDAAAPLEPNWNAAASGGEGGDLRLAQADCSAAAAQAAAQTGGEVLSVQASSQGGQTVCVVTVLIPGQGGERPRRTTITLPG